MTGNGNTGLTCVSVYQSIASFRQAQWSTLCMAPVLSKVEGRGVVFARSSINKTIRPANG